jgi:hypothetical protein
MAIVDQAEEPLARRVAHLGATRPWRAGSEMEATRTMERVEQASLL